MFKNADEYENINKFLEDHVCRSSDGKLLRGNNLKITFIKGTPSGVKGDVITGVVLGYREYTKAVKPHVKNVKSKALGPIVIGNMDNLISSHAHEDNFVHEFRDTNAQFQFAVLSPKLFEKMYKKSSINLHITEARYRNLRASIRVLNRESEANELYGKIEMPSNVQLSSNGNSLSLKSKSTQTIADILPSNVASIGKQKVVITPPAPITLNKQISVNVIKEPVAIKSKATPISDLRTTAILLPIKGHNKKTVEDHLGPLQNLMIEKGSPINNLGLQRYAQDNVKKAHTSKIIINANGRPLGMLITLQDYPKICNFGLGVPKELTLDMAKSLNLLGSQRVNAPSFIKNTVIPVVASRKAVPAVLKIPKATKKEKGKIGQADIKNIKDAIHTFKPSNILNQIRFIPTAIDSKTLDLTRKKIHGAVISEALAQKLLTGTSIHVRKTKYVDGQTQALSVSDMENSPKKTLRGGTADARFARKPHITVARDNTAQGYVYISSALVLGLHASGRL